jgi:hypothetical protein
MSNEENKEEQFYNYNRELFYTFDKEKGYTRTVSYQNPSNQTIIKQSWDAAEDRLEEVRAKVLAGKVSPIAYYMEKVLMEVPMLAAYMEIPKWRVKWHLRPGAFKRLSPAMLQKYASVLEITPGELTNIDLLRNKNS